MRIFGKQLTKEQVAEAQRTALQPFNEPTDVVAVEHDTVEALIASGWTPKEDAENVRWRTEVNCTTGEVKHIELTLEEYAARHINKAKSRNEYVLRKRAEAEAKAKADKREALLAVLENVDPAKLARLLEK